MYFQIMNDMHKNVVEWVIKTYRANFKLSVVNMKTGWGYFPSYPNALSIVRYWLQKEKHHFAAMQSLRAPITWILLANFMFASQKGQKDRVDFRKSAGKATKMSKGMKDLQTSLGLQFGEALGHMAEVTKSWR